MSALLHRLLEVQLQSAPEYLDGGLANTSAQPPGGGAYASHLPMALHALAALGASSEQLQAFFSTAQAPMPQRPSWPALDAEEQRLRAAFQSEGASSVLAGELALALAWWAALLRLQAPSAINGNWIALHMQAWVQDPRFARIAPQLRLQPDTLQHLATLALQAYADSGDFTLLHLVTASRALQVLGPLMPPPACDKTLRDFSLHAAAGLLASRWRGERLAAVTPWDWPRLLAAARAEANDHAIKLVHAARHWQQQGDDDLLARSAATRALHAA
jgi:hypothetical protein